MSIYPGTRNDREYAAGFDDGRTWAEQDLDADATAYWLDTLQGEVATFRDVGSRSVRAYYLGALRGYRESTRTQRDGRWTT